MRTVRLEISQCSLVVCLLFYARSSVSARLRVLLRTAEPPRKSLLQ
jgi:hypothetical protein